MITIHWMNGDKSTWGASFLSYADGFLYDFDHLHVSEMEELGVRVSRGFHSVDPSDETAHFIAEEKVIIAPEELGSVLMVLHGGTVKLMHDPKTGKLADVLLPQVEALVFGEDEGKEPIEEVEAVIGKTEESLDGIDSGLGL